MLLSFTDCEMKLWITNGNKVLLDIIANLKNININYNINYNIN